MYVLTCVISVMLYEITLFIFIKWQAVKFWETLNNQFILEWLQNITLSISRRSLYTQLIYAYTIPKYLYSSTNSISFMLRIKSIWMDFDKRNCTIIYFDRSIHIYTIDLDILAFTVNVINRLNNKQRIA